MNSDEMPQREDEEALEEVSQMMFQQQCPNELENLVYELSRTHNRIKELGNSDLMNKSYELLQMIKAL